MSTKDLGDLGVAAGDIFAKAFTLGYETGRKYVPSGGMALTAEQVEDVRLLLGLNGSQDIKVVLDAQARLRALFPATEPAEEVKPISWYRTMELDFAAKHFGFPSNPVFEDRYTAPDGGKWQWTDELQWELRCYPPDPAEPAEEETKAEVVQDIEVMQWDGTRKSIQAICDWVNSFDDELDDPTISYCFSSAAPDDVLDVSLTTNEGDFVRVSDGDFIVRDTQGNFYRRDRNAYATVAASSPVVVAPTETEWQTWQEVPDGVVYTSSRTPWHRWKNVKGERRHKMAAFPESPWGMSGAHEQTMTERAPFVAAEKKS